MPYSAERPVEDCQSRESELADWAAVLARAFAEIAVDRWADMASADILAAAVAASDSLAVAFDRSWRCSRVAGVEVDREIDWVICTWEFDLDRDKVYSDKSVDMERAHKMRKVACQVVEVASAVLDRVEVDSIEVQADLMARCWAQLAVEYRFHLRPVTSSSH